MLTTLSPVTFEAGLTSNIGEVHGRIQVLLDQLENMDVSLREATDVLYEHTRQRFEDWGAGEWPQLAESTVIRKRSQGFPEPERPLFATGDLFESASSAYGPYSLRIIEPHRAIITVDWELDGAQIPALLSSGNVEQGGHLPARPIWPHDHTLTEEIATVLRGSIV